MECQSQGVDTYRCEWRIDDYITLTRKCSPREIGGTADSEALPMGDDLVKCRVKLYPGGFTDEADSMGMTVQFTTSGEGRRMFNCTCLCRSVSSSNEILDDAVQEHVLSCGIVGEYGDEHPLGYILSKDTSTLVIMVTFKPFAEERELMDNVRHGLFSFQSAVSSLMSQPQPARDLGHESDPVPESCTQEDGGSALSTDDVSYATTILQVPDGGFWTKERWSVLLHIVVAFSVPLGTHSYLLQPPTDAMKQRLFDACPPMRARALESSHDREDAAHFWNELHIMLGTYAEVTSVEELRQRLRDVREAEELLHVLLFAVDPASISYFDACDLERCSAQLREGVELLLESQDANKEILCSLATALDNAREIEHKALAKQRLLRERIRGLVSYHTWHPAAESCLSSQLLKAEVNPLSGCIALGEQLCEVAAA